MDTPFDRKADDRLNPASNLCGAFQHCYSADPSAADRRRSPDPVQP
jgi:hypothetical protein